MQARIEAFRHAFRGARTLVCTQPHARFHAGASVCAVLLGTVVQLQLLEWALVVFSIAIVWTAEAVNTAIEFLADEVSLEWRERIKHAKDVAAFGVLAAAFAALLIGAFVFLPHFTGTT